MIQREGSIFDASAFSDSHAHGDRDGSSFVSARGRFDQSPELYGPIEMRNPATAHVTTAFGAAAAEVAEILGSGDRERFREMFEEVGAFFGPFTHEALEQSGFLIDRLVERL